MLLQKLSCNYLYLTQVRITTGMLFLTAQIHKYVSSVSIYWHQSSYTQHYFLPATDSPHAEHVILDWKSMLPL